MKINALLCIIILGLSSCEWGNTPKKDKHPIFSDTVKYTYQAIHQRAADCGNKPDSACTVAQIKYPTFTGQALLNDIVKTRLLKLFAGSDAKDTSLNTLSKNFIKSYEDSKKKTPRAGMFYELKTYAKVIAQDSALVALEYGGYTYQGGAHGATFTGFLNWNPKANKEIFLKDIFVDNYHDQLRKIAESIFRKNEKLSDTASLKTNYFFKNDRFELNDNYAITPLGLRFLYNQYEIKPYAAGQTELFIPYARIKPLLRPNTVVAQYINRNAGI